MSKNINNTTEREQRLFAYVRVSTKEQNTDRQLIALEPYQIPAANIYIDKKSGKDFNRPRYKSMLRKLRVGGVY